MVLVNHDEGARNERFVCFSLLLNESKSRHCRNTCEFMLKAFYLSSSSISFVFILSLGSEFAAFF